MSQAVESVPVVRLVPTRRASAGRLRSFLAFVFGWLWRLSAGVFLCCNFFPLGYFTSIFVAGWLQRWTAAIVLRGWWRLSPAHAGSFADWRATLGPDAPTPRPRWLLREPGSRTSSLWLNFRDGLKVLLATYLITGWGAVLMLFSWYFGWHNSFHKGYEDSAFGPALGIAGSVLFAAALPYVLVAQVHQAVAGQFAAFFQTRVVFRLLRARLTAYVGLVALFALVGLVFDATRLAVLNDDFGGNRAETAAEGLVHFRNYMLACTAFFFPVLLLARGLAAVTYRSAVLAALRRGTIAPADLPARTADYLRALELGDASAIRQPSSWLQATGRFVGGLARRSYRSVLYTVLVVLLVLGLARVYVGYFLVANGFRGFLNHPFIHLPCIDSTPWHLMLGRDE